MDTYDEWLANDYASSANKQIPHREALLAWWIGENATATTWNDSSGNGKNLAGSGVSVNTRFLNNRPVPKFTAGTGRYTIAHFIRALSAFSLTVLFEADANNAAVAGYNSVIGEGPSGNPWPDWAIVQGNGTMWYSQAQGSPPPTNAVPCTFGQWQTFSIVKDGSEFWVYGPGAVLLAYTASHTWHGAAWGANMGVGWNSYPFDARGLNGCAAEIAIHNIGLRATGIQAMHAYMASEWGLTQ